MVQTLFGKDIAFSLRTFRFIDAQSSADDQEQTITCQLYLEPADQVPEEQAADCTCFDEDDCAAEPYCIEVIPEGNGGDELLILQNDQVRLTIPDHPDFTETQTVCFDSFDLENDIFEIRHNGPTTKDGVSIHVNLNYQDVTTQLLFGPNADLDFITLDASSGPSSIDGWYCKPEHEAAGTVKIQNNAIIESSCVSPTDPSLVWLPYCIEVSPEGNGGDEILILQNDQVRLTIPDYFTETQTVCFNSYNLENDIFEIRHNGPNDGVSIHVNLNHGDVTTQLLFGPNADLDFITMDALLNGGATLMAVDGWYCKPEHEATGTIKIQNNAIIESSCVSPADPSLVWLP